LQASPLHASAIARHEAVLRRLLQLGDLPDQSAGYRVRSMGGGFPPRGPLAGWSVMAAAAAAIFALVVWRSAAPGVAPGGDSSAEQCLQLTPRRTLPDGSVVELKKGSRIAVQFSPQERRVVLVAGEANFRVVHNRQRPFVVEVGSALVRDIGTVFDVRRDPTSVQILVTEGSVSVNRPNTPELTAGQRALVDLGNSGPAAVTSMPATALADALSWQKPRFEFSSTPLSVAVDAFNRRAASRSGPRLSIGDPALAAVRIGGSLRADDVEDFVRLLGYTEGIRAERSITGQIVLRASR
jgi:transmembrane sensor